MVDKQWQKFERAERRKRKREAWKAKPTSDKAAIIWLYSIFGFLAFIVITGLLGVMVACNLSDFRHAWPVDVAALLVAVSLAAAQKLSD